MTGQDLSGSCAALAALLPAVGALTAEPDTTTVTGHAQPASRPPWNQAAASAALDAHEGIRRLEASMRLAVTGRTGPRRGGADAATATALAAIEALGNAVTTAAMAQAARILDRWSAQIQQLPAIDEAEPARMLHGVACPYCHFGMLAVWPRKGKIACVRYGRGRGLCPGDSQGHPPEGHMDVSRLTGDPVIRWNDGLVT